MKVLEQIFDQGYAVKDITLGETKIKAKVRNLATEDQLNIEKQMQTVAPGRTSAYVLHKYSIGVLSHTLLELNGQSFKDANEVEARLLKLPTPVCDALIQAQNAFEKEVAELINPKAVEKTFFDQGSTPEKQEQSPAELSSEKEEA